MTHSDEAMNRSLLIGFTVGSVLLFGFIAWKPQVWVSLTPIKLCNDERLAKIYRWVAIITLISLFLHLLLFVKI